MPKKVNFTKEILVKEYLTDKKTGIEIGKKYDVRYETVYLWLEKFNIKRRHGTAGGFNKKDRIGKRYGRLVVVKRVGYFDKRHDTLWECKCDCGKMIVIGGGNLSDRKTRSCGCLRQETLYTGHENLSGSYWNSIKKGAEYRGLKLDITIKDAWNQFCKQGMKCALSGLPITLYKHYSSDRSQQTASLDRIDSSKGYVKGNIQWVHKDINEMKMDKKEDYFIFLCKKIAKHKNNPTLLYCP
jgi:hypothetical protein